MQERTIITTVGMSLLTNAQRDLGLPREKPPGPTELAQYLQDTPPRKSERRDQLALPPPAGGRPHYLPALANRGGPTCAEALARHYENQGHPSRVVEVPDLTYTESRFKMRGLRALVATLIGHIREEQGKGRQVLINATGGFKAEIAYATLVGLLFDVPVYYIHEAFRDIIEMPPTPIGWDYSLLADHEEFFEWISTDLRETREVDARLRGLPEEVRLLLVEEEGYTLLSPAGEAFYEAYRSRKDATAGTPIWLSDAAWRTYRDAVPDVQAGFRRVLEKLRMREVWIRRSEIPGNSDCQVYPRGHRDERVFFYEKDSNIYVCELARHSDNSYERLLERGVWRAHYGGWKRWEG